MEPSYKLLHKNCAQDFDVEPMVVSSNWFTLFKKTQNVTLAALTLTYEAIITIRRWWNGEISGKRCVKNIMDAGLTITVGMVAGGMGGAALGSLVFGPVGTVVGGIIGGILCSSATNVASDRITQKLFGIPKEEALENAYIYLSVNMTASNHEINTAFRQLCLKYHPDKPGGSNEEFHFLQLNMAVIKASRNELLLKS